MALVKAPSGTVMDLDESVVSGLVGSVNSGWERVKDEPKSENKSTAKKASSNKR